MYINNNHHYNNYHQQVSIIGNRHQNIHINADTIFNILFNTALHKYLKYNYKNDY